MKAFAIVLALLLLQGCTLLRERPAAAQLAIQYATIKYVDGDQARKDRVIAVVEAARTLTSTSATLAALEAAVRDRIKWNELDAADQVLINGLIVLVHDELARRFADRALDPEQVVAVNQVLDWIAFAASL